MQSLAPTRPQNASRAPAGSQEGREKVKESNQKDTIQHSKEIANLHSKKMAKLNEDKRQWKNLNEPNQYDEECIMTFTSLPNVLQPRYQFNPSKMELVQDIERRCRITPQTEFYQSNKPTVVYLNPEKQEEKQKKNKEVFINQ